MMKTTCCGWAEPRSKHARHPVLPVSEPAAFEEDVTATNCLDLTGFCAPEEIKAKKQNDCIYNRNTTAIRAGYNWQWGPGGVSGREVR